MSDTNNAPAVDLSDYVAKSSSEKRSIIKSLFLGHRGKTKEQLDYEKVWATIHDAFENEWRNPHFSLLIQALADSGCVVDVNSHVVVKSCGDESGLLGSFNHERNQIEICQETFANARLKNMLRLMQTTLSHSMIEAFDHCRANVDVSNPAHDMCIAIRAAALSGQCTADGQRLNKVQLASSRRGYQTCVLEKAVQMFLHKNPTWDMPKTENLIRQVFPTCFNDHSPHDRLPYDETQAKLSHKAYLSRNRYDV